MTGPDVFRSKLVDVSEERPGSIVNMVKNCRLCFSSAWCEELGEAWGEPFNTCRGKSAYAEHWDCVD